MHGSFLNYLLKEGLISPQQVGSPKHPAAYAESWIGRLMVLHGLIGVEHVNEILNRQDLYGGFFGENAVSLGYVTRPQLETLLAAQEVRRNLEMIEEVALAGALDFDDGLRALTQFHLQWLDRPKCETIKTKSVSEREPAVQPA